MGASQLKTTVETVLVVAGCASAAAAVAGVALAVRYGGGQRYRPGRPFEFTQLWLGASPAEPTTRDEPAPSEQPDEGGAPARSHHPGGACGRW